MKKNYYCIIVNYAFKTTINWLFNDIWYYLFIACFDQEIGPFQQTVVRAYYILKSKKINSVHFGVNCDVWRLTFEFAF